MILVVPCGGLTFFRWGLAPWLKETEAEEWVQVQV
jgi:hypothetical protein